jgi:tartrate dehydratase beta subunit/fumarate hydratase class I family protein
LHKKTSLHFNGAIPTANYKVHKTLASSITQLEERKYDMKKAIVISAGERLGKTKDMG